MFENIKIPGFQDVKFKNFQVKRQIRHSFIYCLDFSIMKVQDA